LRKASTGQSTKRHYNFKVTSSSFIWVESRPGRRDDERRKRKEKETRQPENVPPKRKNIRGKKKHAERE